MTKTTTFVWDPVSDCVISELDRTNDVQVVYTNEPQQYGGVLTQRRATTSHFHHHDALGSTRLLTNISGADSDTYLYDAWGNSVASPSSTVNPFKWVGKYGYYTDKSTGQIYVRARMCHPTVARWVSIDPYFSDLLTEPFVYGANHPVTNTDPSGLDWLDAAANYAAGIGDSLSFGLTNYVRNQLGTNGGIDHDGTAYISGMATEIVAEVAVTCGGSLLRRAAGRVAERTIFGNTARAAARRVVPTVIGGITRVTQIGRGQVHHINTLFGHPPIRHIVYNRFGLHISIRLPSWMSSGRSIASLFPASGLPAALYNSRWNLVRVSAEYHRVMHLSAVLAERIVYYQTHAVSVGVKLGLNVSRVCCDPEYPDQEQVEYSLDVEAAFSVQSLEPTPNQPKKQ